MSMDAMKWAWDQKLPPARKVVLLYLADSHNGSTRRCFPAVRRICGHSGLSDGYVREQLTFLEQAGLITRIPRKRPDGSRTSNEYILHIDGPPYRPAGMAPLPPGPCPSNQKQLTDGTAYHDDSRASGAPSRPIAADELSGGEAPGPKQLTKVIPLRERVKLQPPSRTRRPVPPTTVPQVLRPLLDRWMEIGVKHREGTKVYREGVKSLKAVVAGSFFTDKPHCQDKARPYTKEEVLEALERFNASRNNPLYHPKDKTFYRGISLPDFFYSSHLSNGNSGLGGSLFLQMLAQTPVLAGDQHPDLTNHIRDKLFEILGARVTYQEAARASNKIAKYWKENEERLRRYNVRSDKNLATLWMTMCEEWRPGKWHLGNVTGSGLNDMFHNWIKES